MHGGGAVTTMHNTLTPLFEGNISVAGCMPLSSLLKTIKINGGIKCGWCMKKSRLSTNIWSTTAGSKVPSTLGQSLQVIAHIRPIASTFHALYTNATLPLISGDRLSQMLLQKYSKMQHIFAYNGPPGGLPPVTCNFRKFSLS